MAEVAHVQSENSHISISIANFLITWEPITITGPYSQNLISAVFLYVLPGSRGKNIKHVLLTDTKTSLMLIDRKIN